VVTVWQPVAGLGTLAWSGAATSTANSAQLDQSSAEHAGRVASEGVRIAQEAGLHAESVAVEAAGPVWRAIVDIADRHAAATIVVGSRGLTGLHSMLLGSVSSAVVHHAERPALITRQPVAHA
jgi:nucleotide-binding universal stress UspA family protein